jgi:hypothetical protein
VRFEGENQAISRTYMPAIHRKSEGAPALSSRFDSKCSRVLQSTYNRGYAAMPWQAMADFWRAYEVE